MADINVSSLKTQIKQQTDSNQLVVGKDYLFTANDTVTLPTVSGLLNGTTIRCIKNDDIVPEIQVEGSSGEQIRVNITDKLDTAILFDIECEIILLWDSVKNQWEV